MRVPGGARGAGEPEVAAHGTGGSQAAGEQGLGGQGEPLVLWGNRCRLEGEQGLGGHGVSLVFGVEGTAYG